MLLIQSRMDSLTAEITRKKRDSADWIDELIDIVLVYADEIRNAIQEAVQSLYEEQYYGVWYSNSAQPLSAPELWQGLHDKLSGENFFERIEELLNPETILIADSKGLADVTRQINALVGNEGERATNAARQQAGIDAEDVADVIATKTWDATLDERTRDTHWLLHSQTVGINDWFQTINGRTQRPGEFRVPEEDINCRCRLIVRLHGDYPELVADSYDEWVANA